MSKYKVGDLVVCEVEIRQDGRKYILSSEKEVDPKNLSEDVFQIVLISTVAEDWNNYMLVISDDMVGWTINKFHTEIAGVAKAFLGKKFWEVTEQFIIKKAEIKNGTKVSK